MELNQEWLDKAMRAWAQCSGDGRASLAAGIAVYNAEMLTPGELIVGEAIPQRDYRKEVWIAALTTGNGAPWADQVLAHFDKTFPQETNRG